MKRAQPKTQSTREASKRTSEQPSKRAKWHPCIHAFMVLRAYVGKAHRGQARHDVTRVAAKERGKGQECIYAAKHLRTYAGKARKGRPFDVDAHDGSNVDWGVNVRSAASMADFFGEPKFKRNSFQETAGMIHATIAKK